MNTGTFEGERRIFEQALELPPEERPSFVSRACGDSAELAQRVLRLIAAHERAERAASHLVPPPGAVHVDLKSVGPYRILEHLGEGGMGAVYLAEQTSPVRRRVALKVIKLGMDTKEVIARFESESQALALMNHPNIARILDAGTTEQGRPYFVMEYVPGIAIVEYCDKMRYSIDRRLRLFAAVCLAIQHAHQKGIIHRDLKPSNILVSEAEGEPVPKIIDFGVAKATDQRLSTLTLHTRMGFLIGTPEYMSPEQAEMTPLNVDTRSDVYSLGALLYELLVGVHPLEFHAASHAEIQHAIRHVEPELPSRRLLRLAGDEAETVAQRRASSVQALIRKLRSELDWITITALAKDPARRYQTAQSLSHDVERYLNDEPISARAQGPLYRGRKFVSRHRLALVGLAVIVISLLAGLTMAMFGLLQARRERDAAQYARAEAETVTRFLSDTLAAVDPAGRGRDVTVRQVLDEASQSVADDFADRPTIEASLHSTIGQTYERLGEYAKAEPHLERALEIRRSRLGPEDPATLLAQRNLGEFYRLRGRHAEAEPMLEAVLASQRRVLGDAHPETLHSMNQLAILMEAVGRHAAAEALYRECLTAWEQLGPDRLETMEVAENLSILYQYMGRWEQAERLQLKSLAFGSRVRGEEHPETLNSVINLVALYLRQERYLEAEPLAVESLDKLSRVMGPAHPRTLLAMNNLGYLYLQVGRYDESELLLLKSRQIKLEVLHEEHPSTLQTLDSLIALYQATGETDKLERITSETLTIRSRVAQRPNASAATKGYYADMLLKAEPPHLRDPRRALDFAIEAAEETNYGNVSLLRTLAAAHSATGDAARAVNIAEQALALLPEQPTANRIALESELAAYRAQAEER